MRTSYWCQSMQSVYTKLNYECTNACMYTNICACIYSGFFFKSRCDFLYGCFLYWHSPHPALGLVQPSLDRSNPSLGLNPNVG